MTTEYDHVELSFAKPSGFRNGKSFEVTAFLLLPAGLLAEVQAWEASGKEDGVAMYDSLIKRGALLHREGGPAYKEVEKSLFDRNHSVVTEEQYWEKGVQKSASGGVRPLGRFRF